MSDSVIVTSEKQGTSDSHRQAWLVCLSASLFFFYGFFQLNLFDVINEPLRAAFQIDATQLSWMSSTFLWADLLFLLPAGILLDRFSTRNVILISLLLCILGTLGFALTSSFAWACLFHALAGIGNAFCFLACVILVPRWFPPRRQAFVMGCIVTMAFIGGMAAHTPFAYLNQFYGWRNALLIDVFLGFLILLWIAFIVQDHPSKTFSQTTPLPQFSWGEFFSVLLRPQNGLAGLYTCCLNLPIMVICALWGASYLQVVHHLTAFSASNVVSMIFMGSILGCPLVGWLSDRDGQRKRLMVLGGLGTLIIVSILVKTTNLSEPVLKSLFFLLGFMSSSQVISYPLIAESNRSHQIGVATGIASIIIMGGGAVGQIIFGALVQYHAGFAVETYTISDFQSAMWLFPVAMLIALIAAGFIRETYCKPMM